MKAALVALLVLAGGLALSAPAEARAYCTAADTWCPGVVCTYDQQWRVWRCVEDPVIECVRECVVWP